MIKNNTVILIEDAYASGEHKDPYFAALGFLNGDVSKSILVKWDIDNPNADDQCDLVSDWDKPRSVYDLVAGEELSEYTLIHDGERDKITVKSFRPLSVSELLDNLDNYMGIAAGDRLRRIEEMIKNIYVKNTIFGIDVAVEIERNHGNSYSLLYQDENDIGLSIYSDESDVDIYIVDVYNVESDDNGYDSISAEVNNKFMDMVQAEYDSELEEVLKELITERVYELESSEEVSAKAKAGMTASRMIGNYERYKSEDYSHIEDEGKVRNSIIEDLLERPEEFEIYVYVEIENCVKKYDFIYVKTQEDRLVLSDESSDIDSYISNLYGINYHTDTKAYTEKRDELNEKLRGVAEDACDEQWEDIKNDLESKKIQEPSVPRPRSRQELEQTMIEGKLHKSSTSSAIDKAFDKRLSGTRTENSTSIERA